MEEKHEAYQKIIDDYPDMPMPIHIPTIEEQREWYRHLSEEEPVLLLPISFYTIHVPSRQASESLHRYLEEWMEWEKQLQKDFLTGLPDPTIDSNASEWITYKVSVALSDIEQLFKTIHTWNTEPGRIVTVWKNQYGYPGWLDPNVPPPPEKEMYAEYTIDGKMTRVFSSGKLGFTSPDEIPISLPITIQKSNSLEIVEEE